MQALVLALAAVVTALAALPRVDEPLDPSRTPAPGAREAGGVPTQPDILFVLTDDQRPDSMPGVAPTTIPQDVFPNVEALLMNQGITFTRAYNTNPLCAPARASLLAGGFRGQNNGVLFNSEPLGGAPAFDDASSIGTLMQAKGYRTAFIGKYPNNYQDLTGTDTNGQPIPPLHYVPPGWDVFVHRQFSQNMFINNFVFGASTSAGPEYGLKIPGDQAQVPAFVSSLEAQGFPTTVGDYLLAYDLQNQPYNVTFVEDLGLALLEDAKTSPEPWFLFLAVEPPHEPATPDVPDQGVYAGFTYQAGAWGEPDLSDKGVHTRAHAEAQFDDLYAPPNDPDALWQMMLESMRSVDRMMGELVGEIDAHPNLVDQTAIFFASDNGFLWGEHQLTEKRVPYEESVRTPCIVRIPGTPSGVTRDGLVAANLDIPATIFELAGYTPGEIATSIGCDGTSLLPLIQDPQASWRSHLLLQSFGNEVVNGFAWDTAWVCVLQPPLKYIEHDYASPTGGPTRELYDLDADPFEESSQHANPAFAALMASLAQIASQEAGLYLTDFPTFRHDLPPARIGQSYSHALAPRGGTPPYTFALSSYVAGPSSECTRTPPPGIALSPSGVLSGVPTQVGCYEFIVDVHDSSVSPQNGQSQRFASRMRLRVTPPVSLEPGGGHPPGGFQLVDAQASTIDVPVSPVIANGTDSATITVTLSGPAGTPVQGQNVALLVSGSSNTVVQPMGPTDVDGRVTGTVSSTVAEPKQVTAVVTGSGTVLGAKPTVVFTGDPAAIDSSTSSASAAPTTVTANGLATSTITVVVRDALGNPVAGQALTLTSSGSGNVITQRMSTDASGQAQGTIASTVAETKTIRAKVNPGPGQVVLDDTPAVTFVP